MGLVGNGVISMCQGQAIEVGSTSKGTDITVPMKQSNQTTNGNVLNIACGSRFIKIYRGCSFYY